MPEEARAAQHRFESRDRKILIALMAAGALLLIVAIVTAVRTMASTAADTRAVAHTLEVESAIGNLGALAERIETARRGYLIQPRSTFAASMRDSSERFDVAQRNLARLVSDNPAQSARVDQLAALARERDALIAEMLAAPAAAMGDLRGADFDRERGVALIRQTREVVDAMGATEQALLARRNQNQLDSLVAFYTTGGLAIAVLLGLMVAAIVLVMRYNRALTQAQTRLRAVNEGLEDAVAERTSELSRANEEIQRFAYIVSHDLRSPLVNVLGFTSELDAARKTLRGFLDRLFADHPQLRDEAAWLAVEEDLPEALSFIRASTEKMDRLINSILELSRQGRRTLKPEPLDMTELVEGVAASLHQRAEAAGATITVDPLPPITADRVAVEQILSNLVENALKYLSPARTGAVRVEGRKLGRRVEIAVIDNGRGIAPADHSRIFDLFRRAGAQDQPGEGIGLANVRALAYRLGGRVSVESQLDEGARFTLTLPETSLAETPPSPEPAP